MQHYTIYIHLFTNTRIPEELQIPQDIKFSNSIIWQSLVRLVPGVTHVNWGFWGFLVSACDIKNSGVFSKKF